MVELVDGWGRTCLWRIGAGFGLEFRSYSLVGMSRKHEKHS